MIIGERARRDWRNFGPGYDATIIDRGGTGVRGTVALYRFNFRGWPSPVTPATARSPTRSPVWSPTRPTPGHRPINPATIRLPRPTPGYPGTLFPSIERRINPAFARMRKQGGFNKITLYASPRAYTAMFYFLFFRFLCSRFSKISIGPHRDAAQKPFELSRHEYLEWCLEKHTINDFMINYTSPVAK